MLDVKEFIEKMKEEVRDYLPDDVHKEIIIDDVRRHCMLMRCIRHTRTERISDISRLRCRICTRHRETRSSRLR